MISKSKFSVPEEAVEVTDDYQLNLAHYEIHQLKPRGNVLFAGETKEVPFQFFGGENQADGIFARFTDPGNANTKRIITYLETYPRTESFVTITLLQFKMIFISERLSFVASAQQKTIRFEFPFRFLKTHRRKYIRIPLNDSFPASLQFQTDKGIVTRRIKDFSREGMRIKLENEDIDFVIPGMRLKKVVLRLLSKEIVLGLTVVSIYPGNQAGLRIIALSEEDKVWIKDVIRLLMKQILNLDGKRFEEPK